MIEELKALALLLLYPDESIIEELPEIGVVIDNASLLDDEAKASVRAFMEHMLTTPLLTQQQEYVSTFDIGKSASLNLFEHLHGDSRDRGAAMVDLKQVYADHGLEFTGDELPDFLPAFLEFLSGIDVVEAKVWLESIADLVSTIDAELQRLESPWAAVTGAVLNLTGTPRPEPGELAVNDLVPGVDVESYDPPVTFGASPDPTCAGCDSCPSIKDVNGERP